MTDAKFGIIFACIWAVVCPATLFITVPLGLLVLGVAIGNARVKHYSEIMVGPGSDRAHKRIAAAETKRKQSAAIQRRTPVCRVTWVSGSELNGKYAKYNELCPGDWKTR